ncbi:MAG: hypothetical protein IKQ25_03785 [Lachnospiraceae bacterium]|nr:hypothetical protein [Lachnospiraceae bacterium]
MRTRENGRRGKQTGTVLYKEILAVLLVLGLALLGGCNSGTGSGDKRGITIGKSKELPEDTPWNHGYNAIMETEDGYYSNKYGLRSSTVKALQCLRYYEKESGNTILLCNKPECTHDGGDTCEATYKNMVPGNTMLYDGSLYLLGAEKNGTTISINMYRAALDGSAIDKVGTVISADMEQEQEIAYSPNNASGLLILNQKVDYSFIIHKGYAYIPYYLRFGSGSKGFKGAGLMRMNLSNGETQELHKTETLVAGVPARVTAVGNYVYFLLVSVNGQPWTRRYDISKNEVEEVCLTYLDEKGKERKNEQPYWMFTEDRYYAVYPNYQGDGVIVTAYNANTKEHMSEEGFYATEIDRASLQTVFCYDGKFFLGDMQKACFYDGQGALLGSIEVPFAQLGFEKGKYKGSTHYVDYKISNGKLYFQYSDLNGSEVQAITIKGETYFTTKGEVQVFSCPLEDIFQGKGEWTKAYVTKGREE